MFPCVTCARHRHPAGCCSRSLAMGGLRSGYHCRGSLQTRVIQFEPHLWVPVVEIKLNPAGIRNREDPNCQSTVNLKHLRWGVCVCWYSPTISDLKHLLPDSRYLCLTARIDVLGGEMRRKGFTSTAFLHPLRMQRIWALALGVSFVEALLPD